LPHHAGRVQKGHRRVSGAAAGKRHKSSQWLQRARGFGSREGGIKKKIGGGEEAPKGKEFAVTSRRSREEKPYTLSGKKKTRRKVLTKFWVSSRPGFDKQQQQK